MSERVILCGKCHVEAEIIKGTVENPLEVVCPKCGRQDEISAVEDALAEYAAYQLDWQITNPGMHGPVIGVDDGLNDVFRWIINDPM